MMHLGYLKKIKTFYSFPPFSLTRDSTCENSVKLINLDHHYSLMGSPDPSNAATRTGISNLSTTDKINIDFIMKEMATLFIVSKTKAAGSFLIGETISNR